MFELASRLRRFLAELRRRRVYTVAASYLVTAFVVVQLAGLAGGAFALPPWFEPLIWVLCGLGFPLALLLAWAYELTPAGMQRTERAGAMMASSAGGTSEATIRAAYSVLVGLGLLAAAAAGGWYLVGGSDAGESAIADRSIAVLPFETLGQSAPTAFTDGIHGDVLTRLANVADLRVISRASVMRYQAATRPLPAIARELGMTWVLRGEVQEAGGQVQVNARLVNAREDRQVWAESYDRRLTAENLFAIQSEITQRIAASLEARLTSQEREQLARAPTDDLEAYQLYAQGRYLANRRTAADLERSVDLYRRAIALDSTFALAYAGLADGYLLLTGFGYGDAPAGPSVAKAEETVRRALTLDPQLGEAHTTLAYIHAHRLRAGPAFREFRRALDSRPSYAQAWFW